MRVISAHQPSRPTSVLPKTERSRASQRTSRRAVTKRAAAANHDKRFSEAAAAAFFSNVATLLNSGVPLVKAIEALAADDTFDRSTAILQSLVQDIRAGTAFSAALANRPDSFSPLVISMVRAGESGGTLVSTLEKISNDIEKRQATKAQIRQALTYPTIVVVLGSFAVTFLMAFVVPVFEETYRKAGMPLPLITRSLIAVSSVVAATWWLVLGIIIGTVIAYRRYRSHPKLRRVRDRFLIRLPVLGAVLRSVLVGRFVQAFGGLLASGVSIKESLELTEKVVNHSDFVDMIRELRFAVTRGEGLGSKLAEYRSLVPPLLAQMVSLGEKSGELGPMMLQIGHYVDKDLTRRTQSMSSMIEPLVTVVMAFAIGTIALAIYLPIFDMFKQVGQ